MNRIHFIAIGGAAMHNLAIALHNKGYLISGSDDEIFEPAYSHLKSNGLLPEKTGWNPSNITKELDGIILGMHARSDNPELIKAQDLGIRIYSYPEYLYEQTKNKRRVVIAGSHGKTTITAMVIHVLKYCNTDFDFMVGSQIDGFDTMVSLNDTSKIAVFEGDEYLTSPIDLRPKFIHYKPHIALISGIAWDHINVFPTFESYLEQFRILVRLIDEKGALVYFSGDHNILSIVQEASKTIQKFPYTGHKYCIEDSGTFLLGKDNLKTPLQIFGMHNLQNINGARLVCNQLGINDEKFYSAIASFSGTSKRLQVLKKTDDTIVFLDFAHSPSKVKATVQAVREQFPDKTLVAVFELHTFSSLNKEFMPQYLGTLDLADIPVVFFNEEVLIHKKLPSISSAFVYDSFNNCKLKVITDKESLEKFLSEQELKNSVLLLMSSGNFAGIDLKTIVER
jgi:UDP-N-acetylmuramate: L-alanyl-gamma-D-glutamyl-meso-diaminopimelate ligase